MKTQIFRCVTRKSALAMWQAHHVKHCIERMHPHVQVALIPMVTKGDKWLDAPLTEVGGKGLFVKELEVALLEGRADFAVHSLKDMPYALPDGLALQAFLARASPYDALVSTHYPSLAALPEGAKVGTSSHRRRIQLQRLRPDLVVVPLRGNVNTRIARMENGDLAAIVLAESGLRRLSLDAHIQQVFTADEMTPAAGQGVLTVEAREDDTGLQRILGHLNHPVTRACVLAERQLNQALGGSCQIPIAAFARDTERGLMLTGKIWSLSGKRAIHVCAEESKLKSAAILGKRVADAMIQQGALDIVASIVQGGHR